MVWRENRLFHYLERLVANVRVTTLRGRRMKTRMVFAGLAAAHGDREAKAKLHDVSQTMTPEEISQAKQMAQACEASDYRNCEY
jgi:hypothetical protein